MRAVDRARADLAAGRAWKARDRLLGALAGAPGDQEVLDLLGEVQYAMGDLPAAGRAWSCTARSGPEVEQALEAWAERHGGSAYEMCLSLPRRLDVGALPEPARQRVRPLWEEAVVEGRRRGSRVFEDGAPRPPVPSARWEWAFGVLLVTVVGVVLLLLVVGLVVAAQTVWGWLT